ncbi:MAG: hypothetical protein N2C14_22175 [Planctomycetales bacterium]
MSAPAEGRRQQRRFLLFASGIFFALHALGAPHGLALILSLMTDVVGVVGFLPAFATLSAFVFAGLLWILLRRQPPAALIDSHQQVPLKVQFTSRTLFLLFVGAAVVLAPLSWMNTDSSWPVAARTTLGVTWMLCVGSLAGLTVVNMTAAPEELRQARFQRGFELGAVPIILFGAAVIACIDVAMIFSVIVGGRNLFAGAWLSMMMIPVGVVAIMGLLCGLTAGLVALTLRVVETPVDDDFPSRRVVESPPNESD